MLLVTVTINILSAYIKKLKQKKCFTKEYISSEAILAFWRLKQEGFYNTKKKKKRCHNYENSK